MKKNIISIVIFIIFNSSIFYGMDFDVEVLRELEAKPGQHFLVNFDKEGEALERERAELKKKQKKFEEDANFQIAQQVSRAQQARADLLERQNKEFKRVFYAGMYTIGGIVIVCLGAILYDVWEKRGVEKKEASPI